MFGNQLTYIQSVNICMYEYDTHVQKHKFQLATMPHAVCQQQEQKVIQSKEHLWQTRFHSSKEPEQQGWIWTECFVLLKEQTKRKRMHSAPIRPYSEAHTHSTRIEKQRCSNFMLRIAESTLQKWNSNFEQLSQVSNQSVGGPRGI